MSTWLIIMLSVLALAAVAGTAYWLKGRFDEREEIRTRRNAKKVVDAYKKRHWTEAERRDLLKHMNLTGKQGKDELLEQAARFEQYSHVNKHSHL
jgi:hypothetical protein